ncbi:hypothetical protein WICPIJ_004641 [Wickerhamomyces pijperi]|uniref:Rab-GAP TBC domain-containing protein n=1 Tax=Wickerhamomyces pijperi TaxID=599730 RepID=A0A9P8Q7M7_WICPI|nr:hypothetical protein WICPIJ_004641 [Wickerhamomyces pijperi]
MTPSTTPQVKLPSWIELFINDNQITDAEGHIAKDWETLPEHHDESQVELDVNRSFSHFITANEDADSTITLASSDRTDDTSSEAERILVTESEKEKLRSLLTATIRRILRTFRDLNYYQGYHDIISLIILTLYQHNKGKVSIPDLANYTYEIGVRLSLITLRDFHMRSIQPSIDLINLIPELIMHFDTELGVMLGLDGVIDSGTPPVWCLSPLITLLSHDLCGVDHCLKVLRFVIEENHGDLKCVVLTIVQLIIGRKDWFKAKLVSVGEEERYDVIHSSLSKVFGLITREEVDEALSVVRTQMLKDYHSALFEQTWIWEDISKLSVLKTDLFKADCVDLDEKHESKTLLTSAEVSDINELLNKQSDQSLVPHPIRARPPRVQSTELIVQTFSKLQYLTNILYPFTTASAHKQNKISRPTTNTRLLKLTIIVGILGILLSHYFSNNLSSYNTSSEYVAAYGAYYYHTASNVGARFLKRIVGL